MFQTKILKYESEVNDLHLVVKMFLKREDQTVQWACNYNQWREFPICLVTQRTLNISQMSVCFPLPPTASYLEEPEGQSQNRRVLVTECVDHD